MIGLFDKLSDKDPTTLLLLIVLVMVSTGFVVALMARGYFEYRFKRETLRTIKYQNKGRYVVKNTVNIEPLMECIQLFMDYMKRSQEEE